MNPVASDTLVAENIAARMSHGKAPHVKAPAHAPAHAPDAKVGEITGQAAAQASAFHQPKLTKEQKTAEKLRGVKSTFMMPAQLEFFGMLGGGLLGWAAKKLNWERAEATVGIVARVPVRAMRNTTLAEATRLPANLFGEASQEAIRVGGKAVGWAENATARSERLMESAKSAEGKIVGKTAAHIEKMGARLDRLEEGTFGQGLKNKLGGFIEGRKTSSLTKHASAVEKAHEALTTEGVGLKKTIANFFTRNKPANLNGAGELKSVFEGLDASKLHTGADRAEGLRKVVADLEGHLRGGKLTGEAKTRAGNVMKHLQKALGSANALESYEHAANGGSLRAMAGAIGKAMGRVPVFNAVLGVGIVAGLGAVVVTGRGESKEAKAAFKKVSNELADQPDSKFLKSLKTAQKSGKHWGMAKTGMRMVGETAEGSMWMLHGGGGAGMIGAMMLPQLCETIIPGNPMLGALEALDKNDRNELVLQPAERTQLLAQLVGGIESVAKHGGQYNRLAKGMAAEMQERGFKYHDVVQLLGNDAAFNAFATEVSTKQAAEVAKVAAEVKAVAPVKPLVASNNNPHLATAPSTRIGVGAVDAHHKGMVTDNRHIAMA